MQTLALKYLLWNSYWFSDSSFLRFDGASTRFFVIHLPMLKIRGDDFPPSDSLPSSSNSTGLSPTAVAAIAIVPARSRSCRREVLAARRRRSSRMPPCAACPRCCPAAPAARCFLGLHAPAAGHAARCPAAPAALLLGLLAAAARHPSAGEEAVKDPFYKNVRLGIDKC